MPAKRQHAKVSRSCDQRTGFPHAAEGTARLVPLMGLLDRGHHCNRYHLLPCGEVEPSLLTEPDGVAVFWPASGIAAGILITLGRRVRSVVVIGVIAATIAANVMGDRSLWTSVFKGFCNAGEAILTAWLIEQWFGRTFAFVGVLRVLGFLIAACIGAAASAIGGAATMTLLHTRGHLGRFGSPGSCRTGSEL